jgi:Circadian oscillating protein COP23
MRDALKMNTPMNKRISKSLNLLPMLAASILVGATGHLTVQPSFAQSTTFYCDASGSHLRTMARTPRGLVTIMNWVKVGSKYDYNPLARCQNVSERLQRLYEQEPSLFITIGRLNGENIICAASERDGPCLRYGLGLLFTVKLGVSPRQTLLQIVNLSDEQRRMVYQDVPLTRPYISINEILNGKVETATPPTTP